MFPLPVNPELRARLFQFQDSSNRDDADFVFDDLCGHVCKPGLTINAVELECLHERDHDRGG